MCVTWQDWEKKFAAMYGDSSNKERADIRMRNIRLKHTLAARSFQRAYRRHISTLFGVPCRHTNLTAPHLQPTIDPTRSILKPLLAVYPVLRKMRRENRASTNIARIWRGYVARVFVKEMYVPHTHLARTTASP